MRHDTPAPAVRTRPSVPLARAALCLDCETIFALDAAGCPRVRVDGDLSLVALGQPTRAARWAARRDGGCMIAVTLYLGAFLLGCLALGPLVVWVLGL